MNEFDLLQTSAGIMSAQRAALDVYARNVATAEAQNADGGFTRLIPQIDLDDDGIVVFAGTKAVSEPPIWVHDPSNPFAAASGAHRGYVAHSSVDVLTEMVAAMDASRAYESGASLFDTGKRLAERTLDVERQ